MSRTVLRMALLVALTVSVSGATVGSSGFSAVEADRAVSVNVVDNDAAYVGVVACEKADENGTSNGKAPIRVWVTNRYTETLTVASVASADADWTNKNANHDTVGVGQDEQFETVFDSKPDTVRVTVTADGFDASVTRTVTPKSECPYAMGSSEDSGSAGNSTETTGTTNGTST